MSSLPSKQLPYPFNHITPGPQESVSGKRKSQSSDVEGEGPCKKNHNSVPKGVDTSAINWRHWPHGSDPKQEQAEIKGLNIPEIIKYYSVRTRVEFADSFRSLRQAWDKQAKKVDKLESEAAKLNSIQLKYDKLKASFKRQTKEMHKLRDSLSLEQSHVGILSEKIKKLEAKKKEVIDEYRTSEEFGKEVLFFAHIYAQSTHSVGYAEALKDAKEKYPIIELSDFPLFNPNAEEESQLKILIDEVGWRPCENRAAPVADKAEASGSKPAEDKH